MIYAQGTAIAVLYTALNYRLFWKYGELNILGNTIGAFFLFMAFWSHYQASSWSGANPGYVEWHHFRTTE